MSNSTQSYCFLLALTVLSVLLSACTPQMNSLAASTLQAADFAKDARTLNKEAYELILKNEYEAAIAKAELAVRKDPHFGEAQKNLALAYCDSGRVQDALGPAQKAVTLSPGLDKAHYVLGKVFFRLERLDEAITRLQQTVRVNPNYDKAFFLLGSAYDLSNKPEEARVALDKAVQLQPDAWEYRRFRDSMVAYTKQRTTAALPKFVVNEGPNYDYDSSVYSGIFYEALIHRDFDLLERAADAARASREKLPGGIWKLQLIYSAVDRPYWPTSDFEWKQHLELLKQWTREKPHSLTAQAALASCYNNFAWNARGDGYANTVSERNWELFRERLEQARNILWPSRGKRVSPQWYSVMLQVALGQGWGKESQETLVAEAVQYEPTWYDYYKQKVMFLLPRWGGAPGELEAYVNSFAIRRDGPDHPIIHFLISQRACYFELEENGKPARYYEVLKQGFLDLQKAYGATSHDKNWIYRKALLANDTAFANALYPPEKVKELSDLPAGRTNKEMFDAAVKAFEESKKKRRP